MQSNSHQDAGSLTFIANIVGDGDQVCVLKNLLCYIASWEEEVNVTFNDVICNEEFSAV